MRFFFLARTVTWPLCESEWLYWKHRFFRSVVTTTNGNSLEICESAWRKESLMSSLSIFINSLAHGNVFINALPRLDSAEEKKATRKKTFHERMAKIKVMADRNRYASCSFMTMTTTFRSIRFQVVARVFGFVCERFQRSTFNFVCQSFFPPMQWPGLSARYSCASN